MVLRLLPGESRFFANLTPLHLRYSIAILKPIWEKPKCIKKQQLEMWVGWFVCFGWLVDFQQTRIRIKCHRGLFLGWKSWESCASAHVSCTCCCCFGVSSQLLFIYFDFLLSTMVNHHSTTIWEYFLFFPCISSQSKWGIHIWGWSKIMGHPTWTLEDAPQIMAN